MSSVPLCYYGSSYPLPVRRPLRAGPLTLEYEDGDLRYIRLGDREVVRRWYVAVRDRDWGTVPGHLSGENIEIESDHFRIEYCVEHRQGDIDLAWTGSISGTAEGTIRFRMEGIARSTFLRNRIGFCVLHPIRECTARLRRARSLGSSAPRIRFANSARSATRSYPASGPSCDLRAISSRWRTSAIGPMLRSRRFALRCIYPFRSRSWKERGFARPSRCDCRAVSQPFPPRRRRRRLPSERRLWVPYRAWD